MAIQFPNNPGIGSVFTDTDAGFSYEWTGVVWKSFTPAAANNIKELDDISSSFDNSTTTFDLTISGAAYQPRNAAMLQISLGGVIQEPSTDYTVSTSTITFTTAPSSGLDFFGVVRGTAVAIDYANDGNVQTKQEFTATLGQTSFTVTGGYTAGAIDVFRNGVRLGSDDFTDTSGTAIVLTVPAQADDLIETVKYNVASIITTAGQFENLNISGVTTVGVVTGGTSVSASHFYGDGSALTGIDATAISDSGGNVKAQANPGGIVITGVATASSFVGDITGNVTGTATGLSGSPTIAVTNVTGAAATFTGNVSIAGTLTYEDVSNVDSVGLITARKGIQVLADGVNITGITTVGTALSLAGGVALEMGTTADEAGTFKMYNDSERYFEIFPGTSDKSIYIRNNGTNAGDMRINSRDAVEIGGGGGGSGDYSIRASSTGEAELYQQVGGVSGPSELRLTTDEGGVIITGVCTATSFSGSGANLTNLPSSGGDSNDITASLFI